MCVISVSSPLSPWWWRSSVCDVAELPIVKLRLLCFSRFLVPTMAIKLSLNITYDRANLLIRRERSNSGLFDPSTLSDYPELLIASPCQPPAGSSPTQLPVAETRWMGRSAAKARAFGQHREEGYPRRRTSGIAPCCVSARHGWGKVTWRGCDTGRIYGLQGGPER